MRPGQPCSCSTHRRVRYVIPPVPGLPRGEISCRPEGDSTSWLETNRHDAPSDLEHEVLVGAIAL